MSKPITNLLKRALRRIEKGWTQGPYAVNSRGVVVGAKSPSACKWCAEGAIMAVAPSPKEYAAMRRYLSGAIQGYSLILFNERAGRKKREVVAAFKRAVKLAEKEGA